MRDIPIIFSAPMIKALLDGRKSMTRRLAVSACKKCQTGKHRCIHWQNGGWFPSPWQRVVPGDRLWVRENYCGEASYDATKPRDLPDDACQIYYPASDSWSDRDDMTVCGKIRPSIYMPRWATRLTLVVTATKTERLQNLTENDALAEGVERNINGTFGVRGPLGGWLGTNFDTAATAFKYLWMSLHGAEVWYDNPEVVAISFQVHKYNIDAVPKDIAA